MADLLRGFRYLLRGLALIWKPGVKTYAFTPIAINVIVFALLFWWGIQEFEQLLQWMLPDQGNWWIDWLRPVLWVLFALLAFLLLFFTFTVTANLIAAPFNGALAAKVEASLTGESPAETGFAGIIRDAGPMIWNEIKKILYAAAWVVPALILFLIPGLNLVAPLLWLLLMAWLMALEYLDYPMGNHDMPFKTMRGQLRRRRPLALGFGAAVLAVAIVPGLNLILMPAAVAGATALWVEELKTSTQ